MANKIPLTDHEKGMLQALNEEGHSAREIGRRLGISDSTVRYNLRKLNEYGSMDTLPRSGRPRATNERDDRHIVLTCRRNRFLTAPELAIDLANTSGVDVHPSTISRRLADAGLYGRVARHKPRLTAVHKQRRLDWARQHLTWTPVEWDTVLWSDESRFQLFQSDGRVYVRRAVGEEFHEACVAPSVKHGGSGIMVWGCMGSSGVGSLAWIKENINAKVYIDILRDHMLPSAHHMIGHEFIFQHDNAPPHTALITREFITDPTPEFIREMGGSWQFEVMEWPAQSPDLNPLENLWDEMERRLHREDRPRNKDHLFEILKQIWEGMDRQIITNLLASMPRRCQAVIDARGAFTRY